MRSGHAAGGVGAREEQPRITNGWTGWLDPVAHRATRWGRAVSGGASLPTEGANLSPDSREGARYPQAGWQDALSRIPTIRDRVVQMALKLVLEPIFETD